MRARAHIANLPRAPATRRWRATDAELFAAASARAPLAMPLRCFVLAASVAQAFATPSPTCTPVPTPAAAGGGDVYRRVLSLARRLWSADGPPLTGANCGPTYDPYGIVAGYLPESDVWKHAMLDLDMGEIKAALAEDPIDFEEAIDICACARHLRERRRVRVCSPVTLAYCTARTRRRKRQELDQGQCIPHDQGLQYIGAQQHEWVSVKP